VGNGIKKQKEEDIGLEVSTGETNCMVVSGHQNAGQKHNLLLRNKSFENAEKLKYLGTRVTKIARNYEKLNSGNACHHSTQSFFFRSPL
jgi:hypothetical protein